MWEVGSEVTAKNSPLAGREGKEPGQMRAEEAESGECQAGYRVRGSQQRRGVGGRGKVNAFTYSGRWQDLG